MKTSKEIVESLLAGSGITLNGRNDWDPQIKTEAFYDRVLREGSLGLGESYMDGWWECKALDEFFNKLLRANIEAKVKKNWKLVARLIINKILSSGRKSKAFEIGQKHYDLGNDLYKAMLDKRMTYTCGYWKTAKTLDKAQEAKLDLICKKIGLKKGQTVLDIGSGWGSFIGYAAQEYGAHATGVTVSIEQKNLADKLYQKFGAETKLQDYRDINEVYNHVVSVGMFEHVNSPYYRQFMEVAHRALQDDGLFLLHTIGTNQPGGVDPWILKYIFPNSMLPSASQITKAYEGLFVMEDWHNFGPSYDKTLMAWYDNFEKAWPKLKEKYDTRFYRMWRYYLLCCAGAFRSRNIQLWQIVLSKKGVKSGYKSIR